MDEYQLGEQVIKSSIKYPKRIYLDLNLFKDFFLGTVLSMINSEEEYNYILSNLMEYIVRYIDDIEYIFPKLNIPNDKFIEFQKTLDPNKLFYASPGTTFISEFSSYMSNINNQAAVVKDKSVVNITINTYPLDLNINIKKKIAREFSLGYAVNVNIICIPLYNLKIEEILKYDAFFIYDFKSLITSHHAKAFSDMKFEFKTIKTIRQVESLDVFKKHKSDEDIEYDFIVTEAYLKIICDFTYLPPVGVLIKDKTE
jgi:hypothetical protein